jgi:hypothetical protein
MRKEGFVCVSQFPQYARILTLLIGSVNSLSVSEEGSSTDVAITAGRENDSPHKCILTRALRDIYHRSRRPP